MEEFTHGDHTTKTDVGDLQYTTLQGQWAAKAAQNHIKLDGTDGLYIYAPTGDAVVETAGAASYTGNQSATVRATSGPALVTGQSGTTLGGPGLPAGNWGIVNGSDLDPLTGAPLHTYTMGSSGHRLKGHS